MLDVRAKRILVGLLLLAMGAVLATTSVKPAEAQLLISPLRITFEGGKRSSTVILTNMGNEAATYRLVWQEKLATPDGQYQEVADPPPTMQIASPYVRFSPRQVTLRPGERQQVRLALRLPADIPVGEYRSHLAFVVIDERERRAARQDAGQGAAIQVFMNLGFAIPIMVRHGQGRATINLVNAELSVDDINRLGLNVQLGREGNFSAYGRLKVYWRQNENSTESQVGLLQNVAVYPEVDSREATVLLNRQELPPGILRVVYEGVHEYSDTTWIDRSFQIGD